MIRTIWTIAAMVAVCGVTPCLKAADAGSKKCALLVGVNKYLKPDFKDLKFAEADVIAVGAELRMLGFTVRVLLGSGAGESQATLANIERAASEMVADLGQNDVALVMLSGHGQQLNSDPDEVNLDNSQSYFCPVDAVVNHAETQFSLSHLVDDILAPNVGRKLLLVDACRDIPVDRTRGRNTKGIEGRIVSLPEDTAVFFSCRAGQTSFEHDELGHGLFTYCVLEGLRGEAVAPSGELAWSRLVAHVDERMQQEDIVKFMPGQQKQVPIPAGALPYTVLGHGVGADWIELFNGRDLTGWRMVDSSQPVTRGWKAADGVLTIVPPSGDIRTVDQYSDFELEFDWRALPGSNSGVKYRLPAATPNSPRVGIEYQLQDDSAFNLISRAQLTGSIYAVIGPTFDAAQPVGEWNTSRVSARGNRLEHWLNDKRVVNAEVGNADWVAALNAWNQSVPVGMRFANDIGRAPKGYIVLTYRNETVSFRRLRVRELSAAAAPGVE